MGTQLENPDASILAAATLAQQLARRPEVARSWTRPSALPQLSVGALACHLGRQVVRVAERLAVPSHATPLESAHEHYRRAAWVTSTSPEDPANDRTQEDDEAAHGPEVLGRRVSSALRTVRAILASGSAPDVVWLPWQGWALSRHDFLLTRLVEIVVHADDLALSVGVATPRFPPDVFGPVSELLLDLAASRRGQSAVISTLTRSERAQDISAF